MPYEIPCTADGAGKFVIDAGPEYLSLRAYYSLGVEPVWFLDIETVDGEPLALGIPILPGSVNLLRGLGERMEDYGLTAVMTSGRQGDPEAPGDSLKLLFWGPEEAKPETVRPNLADWGTGE